VLKERGRWDYGDDNNYVRLTFGFFDGVGFELGKRVGGAFESLRTHPALSGDVVYVKLTKVGQDYVGWWSEDDTNWTEVGAYDAVGISVNNVGLTAFNIEAVPEIDADFRLFQTLPYAADPAAGESDVDDALASILTAIEGYGSRGVRPLAVLGGGILSIEGAFAPNFGDGSSYIDAFAARAGLIAGKLAARGVTDFEIWNEPNNKGSGDNPEYMVAENFARLVAAASSAITIALTGRAPTIVTGGIFFTEANEASAHEYCIAAMSALPAGAWNQIGVHAYWEVLDNAGPALDQLHDDLGSARVDPRTFWITEFGSSRACENQACTDPNSGGPQAQLLNDWNDVMQPRLVSHGAPDACIGAAFWFCHEREFRSPGSPPLIVENDWGLTDWDRATGDINAQLNHWPSWDQLRAIARIAQAS